MRLHYIAVSLICALLLCSAPAAEAAGAMPPRVSVPEATFDFVSAPQGPPVVHSFTVKNTGQSDLVIGAVQSTCGCTVAQPGKKMLRPGESTRITATFDTRHERGNVSRRIDVYSNDPRTPDQVLTIKGTVTVVAEAVPSEISFGALHKGAGATREIVIRQLDKRAAFKVVKTSNTNSHVHISQLPADGVAARFAVKIAPDTPIGPFEDTITIATNNQPIEVPLYGTVVGDLKAEPAQVSFGILPHGQAAVRYVRLVNGSAHAIAIKSVSSTNSAVSAKSATLEAGKQYRITLHLRPGIPDGQLHGQLNIQTDDPEQPMVSVPYFGIVGSFKS